jgi:hypothetical protein
VPTVAAETTRRLLAAAAYLALTLLLTYPLGINAASTVVGSDADTDLFIWTLAWNTHAFTAQPLAIFDANIYYPFRHTLAYSENLIGSAFFAAPVLWATGSPILALNVATLASVFLCGLGGFVLGRSLGLTPGAAFACGFVFAFAPARFFRISQLHLTAVQWIPFALAALHAYLDAGRRRDLWLAAGFFTLQALSSGHGAVYLAIAAAGLLLYRFAVVDELRPWQRLKDCGAVGLALLAPAALIVIPYRQVQVEMGLRRVLGDQAPAPESFLASPTHVQTFLLSFFPDAHVMERASAILFPGFLTVALALAAFAPGVPEPSAVSGEKRLRHARLYYLLLAIVALLLTTGLVWPFIYWLPGMNFIRVPSRFMILTMVALAVLAGIGTDRLRRFAPARLGAAVPAVVTILLFGEFVAIPFGRVPYEVMLPAADRWLDGQPKPFVVAEVPVRSSDRYQTAYMFHSMAHWQKTVHGYSGFRPPLHETLFRQLQHFPDDDSVAHLRRLGVTYVVVHADQYHEPGEWTDVEARLRNYESQLALEYQDRGARVYRLR